MHTLAKFVLLSYLTMDVVSSLAAQYLLNNILFLQLMQDLVAKFSLLKNFALLIFSKRSQPRKVYTNIVKIEQKSTVQNFKQVERASMASVGSSINKRSKSFTKIRILLYSLGSKTLVAVYLFIQRGNLLIYLMFCSYKSACTYKNQNRDYFHSAAVRRHKAVCVT